jgi:hypothetical protein
MNIRANTGGQLHILRFNKHNMVIPIRRLRPVVKNMQFKPAKRVNLFDPQHLADASL